MISLLLFVFLLQVTLHLFSKFGKQHFNDVLWKTYTLLPNTQSSQTSSLRDDVVRLNREMKATSAQDDFAKWARLRRQHDKAKEKYDREAASNQSTRATFNHIATALRFLLTQGVNFLVNTLYTKRPMFWLPRGWVPYPVEWILSFPRAPLGSVSVNVWGIACASVVGMVVEAVIGVWTLREGRVVEGVRKGEKLKMEVPAASGGSEKKEL